MMMINCYAIAVEGKKFIALKNRNELIEFFFYLFFFK